VVREQEDGERIVAARYAELSALQDPFLVRPITEEVVADRVGALGWEPQDGAARLVLDDERRGGVPDPVAEELA
jgi:hypothetical protein